MDNSNYHNQIKVIYDELLCDFNSTKNIWLTKVKGCKSSIAKFVPNVIKDELWSKSREEITFEVAEYLFHNE